MRSIAIASAMTFAAAVLVSACQCNLPVPCADSRECPAGQTCIGGSCQGPSGSGGNSGTGGSSGTGGAGGAGGCTGLQCQQMTCAGGAKTTISGKVYAPNGTLPLYNAVVYVPNTDVAPFTPGVSCDKCGAGLSGNPIVQTTSDAAGNFRLEDVPAGTNIPLVIQMGRWRRVVRIPTVTACMNNAISDAQVTRLPRTKAEGDIPLMAIATGNADPFECLLRKIGIDDSEFTLPSGTGRVHFHRYNGRDMSPSAPAGSELVGSASNLMRYDVVMLPCEGSHMLKPAAHTQNIIDYTTAGGRVFATHFSYVWIEYAQAPFPTTATWRGNSNAPDGTVYTLDTSFPKGSTFADWLQNVNATTTRGELPIFEPRRNVVSVNNAVAQRWFYSMAQSNVGHYTFNTPVASLLPDGGSPDQCGRVVFSDFHVSAAALSGMPTFPASCKTEELSAQEKALAFMLFDLSACVQRDELPPIN